MYKKAPAAAGTSGAEGFLIPHAHSGLARRAEKDISHHPADEYRHDDGRPPANDRWIHMDTSTKLDYLIVYPKLYKKSRVTKQKDSRYRESFCLVAPRGNLTVRLKPALHMAVGPLAPRWRKSAFLDGHPAAGKHRFCFPDPLRVRFPATM